MDRDTGRKVVKSLQSLLSRTLTASRRISQYVLLEDNAERFCRFLVSMMLAPSIPQVLKELRPDGGGEFLGSFTVTVYILGFVVGPLLFGPLSDIKGRLFILRFTTVSYLAFTVACALSRTLGMLVAFRFMAGVFGSAPMVIGGGVVADLYEPGQRTRPMAWYSTGAAIAPTLGPAMGGVITGSLNWRWVFWIAAILVSHCTNFEVFQSHSY